MRLRRYQSKDCQEMWQLFYKTVHTINAKDYTNEQIDVWASHQFDVEGWNQRFLTHNTIVAIQDGLIVGFANMDESGYLDCLYVHHAYQRQGIATALCDELEKQSQCHQWHTYASLTARPFFEARGYRVMKAQQVERRGIRLTNFIMLKEQS